MIQDRPYQREAVQALEAAFSRGVRRPAVALPTGTGKTVVISKVIKRRHERPYGEPAGTTLVMAHTEELIYQAVEKLNDIAPELRVGIVMASRNETRADVVVASVQTLRDERRRLMIPDVRLIVVDEAHHAVASTYLAVLGHYGAWGDGPPVGQQARAVAAGFSATYSRGDDKALGEVWQQIVYARGIGEMVRAGYLVRPRGIRVKVDDLNLDAVKRSRGDYVSGDLGRAVSDSMAPEAIAKAIMEHCPTDPGLVFTPTVDSAEIVAEAMRGVGLNVDVMHGKLKQADREDIIRRFKAGQLDWIVNCAILTEGVDLPRAKVVVMARPTRSKTLYIQCAGRVLRPYPGKHEAIILDVVGATEHHSLNASIELFGEESVGIKEKTERDDADLLEEEMIGDLLPGQATAETAFGLDYRDGPLVSEEVDLFHDSDAAWKQTRAGIWFINAGERLIALVPGYQAGTWDVTWMHEHRREAQWIVTGVHDLGYAMAYAEGNITPLERMNALKERRWRKSKPTEPQRKLAARLRLHISPEMASGEVSEMISVALASQRIDPYIPQWARVSA